MKREEKRDRSKDSRRRDTSDEQRNPKEEWKKTAPASDAKRWDREEVEDEEEDVPLGDEEGLTEDDPMMSP